MKEYSKDKPTKIQVRNTELDKTTKYGQSMMQQQIQTEAEEAVLEEGIDKIEWKEGSRDMHEVSAYANDWNTDYPRLIQYKESRRMCS